VLFRSQKIFQVRQFRISFAGTGNVASALSRNFLSREHIIEHFISINEKKGRQLADRCNASWSDKYIFPLTSDIIIVAVPDHDLKEVLNKIECNESAIIAHTAGSVGLDVFPHHFRNTGIFYPLQTFSHKRETDISSVPLFIEASNNTSEDALKQLAGSVSSLVYVSDTEHRRLLHLAAVFVSNFTNHMFTEGKNISQSAGFPFEVLKPLILETVDKALEMGPENAQTGPAVRYDLNTIKKHLELLSFSTEQKEIYDLISRSIISYYNKKNQDG
jgi:predicted short-subunit dehydrogenase-like oxidoreductase (DUF2520 family)